jgi:hypothetical protein
MEETLSVRKYFCKDFLKQSTFWCKKNAFGLPEIWWHTSTAPQECFYCITSSTSTNNPSCAASSLDPQTSSPIIRAVVPAPWHHETSSRNGGSFLKFPFSKCFIHLLERLRRHWTGFQIFFYFAGVTEGRLISCQLCNQPPAGLRHCLPATSLPLPACFVAIWMQCCLLSATPLPATNDDNAVSSSVTSSLSLSLFCLHHHLSHFRHLRLQKLFSFFLLKGMSSEI